MFRHRVIRQTLVSLVSLSLVVSTSGCMTPPPSPELHRQLLGQRIALRSDPDEFRISLDIFAKSKPQGALKGAGEGIVGMFGGANCSGEVCGAVLLVMLGVAVVVGGSVGAIEGLRNATSKQRAEEIEAYAEGRLASFPSDLDLARRVLAKGREVAGLDLELVNTSRTGTTEPDLGELQALQTEGFGKILDLRLTRLAFVGDKGNDPHLQLAIDAELTLIDTASGQQENRRTFHYLGIARRYSEWLAGDAGELAKNLDAGMNRLADDIAATLFGASDPPLSPGTQSPRAFSMIPSLAGDGCKSAGVPTWNHDHLRAL